MSFKDQIIDQQNWAEWTGGKHTSEPKNSASKDQEKDEGTALLPVPDDAPTEVPNHYKMDKPVKVWEYKDECGELLMKVCRFNTDLGKEDRPLTYRQYSNGTRRWAYKGLDKPRPLYGLDRLVDRPDAPVIVCEGEKATDAAQVLFPEYVAITSPNGAKSAHSADWQPLKGRHITIWPDHDAPGRAYAKSTAQILSDLNTETLVVTIPESFPSGWDLADPLPEGISNQTLAIMLTEAKPAIIDPLKELVERAKINPGAAFESEVVEALIDLKQKDRSTFETLRGQLKKAGVRVNELEKVMYAESHDGQQSDPSQADILVDLASSVELFHTENKTAYGNVTIGSHRETYPVRSRQFKHYLIKLYYEALESAPSSESVNAAINVIEAKAIFNGLQHPVYIRTAEFEGKIYIDLCLPDWRVVEIDALGWRLVDNPPVYFRRPSGMLPLPLPVHGGDINDLRKFLNVSDEADFVLSVSWILAALRPSGPYPLMVISGEQGSAKSTYASLMRKMTDPNTAALRTLPREIRDLYIAANNGYVLAFDNLSYLSPWISDAFCRLSTGGGFATRQLHTDSDEVLFNSMRPIILNGIDDMVNRPDLADRSILLTLEPIPENKRRTEKEIMTEFEQALPGIMGALFSAISHGLRTLPKTRLDTLPRMADFALWSKACEEFFWPENTFMDAYQDNYAATVETVLQANDVATAVINLLDFHATWTGTADQLLAACEEEVSDTIKKSKPWPKSPRAMSSQLRRSATFLRKTGLVIEMTRNNDRNRTRLITISRVPVEDQDESSVPSVQDANPAPLLQIQRTQPDDTDDRGFDYRDQYID